MMSNVFSSIKKFFASTPQRILRVVRGKYDSAQTDNDNTKHWSMADSSSADSGMSESVRQTVRNRARYEVANNSYAKGIVLTLTNDVIGKGPRLQMLLPSSEQNAVIETAWVLWCKETKFVEKLQTMKQAKVVDGETFALITTNPAIMHTVKVDLVPLEADRCTSLYSSGLDPLDIDGVLLDQYGNVRGYRFYKQHPGSNFFNFGEYMEYPATDVIHIFRRDRPEQHHGISEMAPALPLFAQLRRFTLAVIAAAESAANFAGILYTDAPANGEAESIEPMDAIPLERNMLVTMPGGWKLGQLQPGQPTSTYAEFKCEILKEIARCMNLPANIAQGDSSKYNYASGRLDFQSYFRMMEVDQNQFETEVVNRIFEAWLEEFSLQASWIMTVPTFVSTGTLPHHWFWEGHEHIDPRKEASAQTLRLKNFTTTLATEYAKQGRDWETEVRQFAREFTLMKELGLVSPWQSFAGVPLEDPVIEKSEKIGEYRGGSVSVKEGGVGDQTMKDLAVDEEEKDY